MLRFPSLLLVLYVLSTCALCGCAPLSSARLTSDGPKLAAFRKVVAKYKQSPGNFASDKERERYNRELQVIQNAFSEIPFDVSTNRNEAEAIVRLWESELEGAHTGELYRELDILISSIYMDIRRSE